MEARSSCHGSDGYPARHMPELSPIMPDVEQGLTGFGAFGLDTLTCISLLRRFDTKFVFKRSVLGSVLECLCGDYSVLSIDGRRSFSYETLYFDTADGFFYRQHHDQRVNRFKIRIRHYLDSSSCYVEVKRKTNTKKTVKKRMLLDDQRIHPELSVVSRAFAKSCLGPAHQHLVDAISPSLWVNYSRITLAKPESNERLTFDVDLSYDLTPSLSAEVEYTHIQDNADDDDYMENQVLFQIKYRLP